MGWSMIRASQGIQIPLGISIMSTNSQKEKTLAVGLIGLSNQITITQVHAKFPWIHAEHHAKPQHQDDFHSSGVNGGNQKGWGGGRWRMGRRKVEDGEEEGGGWGGGRWRMGRRKVEDGEEDGEEEGGGWGGGRRRMGRRKVEDGEEEGGG